MFCKRYLFWLYFQTKSRLHQRRKLPSEVFAIDEEERNGVDIDGIRNLKDVPRLVLTDVKFGNLEVVVDG